LLGADQGVFMSNQRKVAYDHQRERLLQEVLEEKTTNKNIFSDDEFESINELGQILRKIHQRLKDEETLDDIISNNENV
jgi:hypothetical protein